MTHQSEARAGANGAGHDRHVGSGKIDAAIVPHSAAKGHLPTELLKFKRWVPWRFDGEGNKVPLVRWSDPANWSSHDAARSRAPKIGGVGIVFNGDGLGGVDLDACRDPETGEIAEWARELIAEFDSYTEISPSGTGVKIFAFGAMPKLPRNVLPMPGETIKGKAPQIEAYVADRFFTVTGNTLPGTPVEVRGAAKAWLRLYQRLESAEPVAGVSNLAQQGRNGALLSFGRKLLALDVPSRVIRACMHAANRAADPELHPSFGTNGALPAAEVETTWRSVIKKPSGSSTDAESERWARDAQDEAFAAWVGAR